MLRPRGRVRVARTLIEKDSPTESAGSSDPSAPRVMPDDGPELTDPETRSPRVNGERAPEASQQWEAAPRSVSVGEAEWLRAELDHTDDLLAVLSTDRVLERVGLVYRRQELAYMLAMNAKGGETAGISPVDSKLRR